MKTLGPAGNEREATLDSSPGETRADAWPLQACPCRLLRSRFRMSPFQAIATAVFSAGEWPT